MRYFLILLLSGSLFACQENQRSNQFMELADEYGVSDMIEVKEGFDEIDHDEWIEILELAVQMKKDVELLKKEHELEKEVIKNFDRELAVAKNEDERQEIWNRYGAKYDWIVLAENTVIKN